MEQPGEVIGGGAFVARVDLEPLGAGPLDGLTFAVKDLVDLAGLTTGGGNPRWLETHPPATVDAVCVEQLRVAGARCVGKTVSDELAFSLLGENFFYGTPLNPRAPERVPGGSSSGSASAVAQGLVDFALGTDTGGSVRVPAGNCGLWGLRPSHGVVSVAGVNPFAPTFDTVGVLASDPGVLVRAASVLLGEPAPTAVGPGAVHLLTDAFALADDDVRTALAPAVEWLRALLGDRVRETRLDELSSSSSEPGLEGWLDIYSVLQWAEIESAVGAWVAAHRPPMGRETEQNFGLVRGLDRRRVGDVVVRREECFRRLAAFLGPTDLLCLPTTPALAPIKGSIGPRDEAAPQDYYPRTLSLTSIAGLGRLPQVSLPLAEAGGVPVGLSLLAGHRRDGFLLRVAEDLAARL